MFVEYVPFFAAMAALNRDISDRAREPDTTFCP